MIVFKCFWKVLLTEKFGLAVFYGLFVILAIFFSVSPPSQGDFVQARQNIAILDEDNSQLSMGLTRHMESLHYLVEIENQHSIIEEALFFGEVDYVLMIPSGFEADFVRNPDGARLENVKSPGSPTGYFVDSQIDIFLVTLKTYVNAQFDLDTAISSTIEDISSGATVVLLGELLGAPTDTTRDFFRFLAFLIMVTCMNSLSTIFITFNKRDLRKRSDCSSMPIFHKNLQLTLGAISSAVFIWILAMVIGVILNGTVMFNQINLLRMINSFTFLVVVVSISFLLGNMLNNRFVLGGLVQVIAMTLSFLTGIFISQELLSEQVRVFARLTPTYWYVRGVDVLSGLPSIDSSVMASFFQGILIQLGFGVAIFSVALVVIRQKRNRAIV